MVIIKTVYNAIALTNISNREFLCQLNHMIESYKNKAISSNNYISFRFPYGEYRGRVQHEFKKVIWL